MIKQIKNWVKSLFNKKTTKEYCDEGVDLLEHSIQLEEDIDNFLASFPKTRRIQLDLEDSLKFVQGQTIEDAVLLEKYSISKEDCAGVIFDLRLMVPQTKIPGDIFLDTEVNIKARNVRHPRKIIQYPDGIRETIYP